MERSEETERGVPSASKVGDVRLPLRFRTRHDSATDSNKTHVVGRAPPFRAALLPL